MKTFPGQNSQFWHFWSSTQSHPWNALRINYEFIDLKIFEFTQKSEKIRVSSMRITLCANSIILRLVNYPPSTDLPDKSPITIDPYYY